MKIDEAIAEKIRLLKLRLVTAQRRSTAIVRELSKHQELQDRVSRGEINELSNSIADLKIELILNPGKLNQEALDHAVAELALLADPNRLRIRDSLRSKKIEIEHMKDALKDEIRELEAQALTPTALVDVELIQTWLSEQMYQAHKKRQLGRPGIHEGVTKLIFGDDHPADCMNEHWAEFDELLINQEVAS